MTDDEKKIEFLSGLKIVQSHFEPAKHDSPWDDKRPAKALVACYFGKAELLDYQGGEISYEIECIGRDALDSSMGVPNEDGIWVWEGHLHSSQDYWGEWDQYLEGEYRKATEEEWQRHLKEEYIWDVPSEEEYAQMAKDREADVARERARERIIDLCVQYFSDVSKSTEEDPEDMPWVLPKLAEAVKEWVEKHR